MIVTLKPDFKKHQKQVDALIQQLNSQNIRVDISEGKIKTLLCLIGDTSKVDRDLIQSLDFVETVNRISVSYKLASKGAHEGDTVVQLNGGKIKIGGGNFVVIAGPCSVESEEQILAVAEKVKASGAQILRGGAFKPRTSPYAFQGLGDQGLKLLAKAKAEAKMPIISEIMDINTLKMFDDVDIIQVGARNMQNFELLKELGKINKPILLKRGLANTIDELLTSAEYIMSNGNKNIILCERGIRTFETATRNTLDLSAIPVIKERTHLPIIVDPSHATGFSKYVEPMALAAVAAGADGLIIEVHNDPKNALCDGAQSLTPEAFDIIMKKITKIRNAISF